MAYASGECPDYTVLKEGDFLMAQITTEAQTILLTTRKPGSNAQVLAVIVGHYLLGHCEPAASMLGHHA